MQYRFTIVGLGEALFDVFPDAEILGGAPLNAAIHAHQLAQAKQGRGVVVSRVGQDALGRQIADELHQRGMTSDYIQTDPDHDTGKVYVTVDNNGQPDYEIVRDAAWDWMNFDPDTEDLARRCEAVCFGTIAQRTAQSRNAIYRFLDTAKHALRLFDVNLRQDIYDQNIVRRSCQRATAVKLNKEELPVVTRLLGLPANDADATAHKIITMYQLKLLVLTRGADGTVIYTPTKKYEGEPVSYPPAQNADSVGAGDACSAGVMVGVVLRKPLEATLALANHAGAYVASQPGATPALPQSILDMAK